MFARIQSDASLTPLVDAPAVSICIPTYNGAQYLADALDSVLAQTFTDFDVLVVDDCSTDHTCAIAEQYAGRDSRIRFSRNVANLGLVENWNRCVDLATGRWIKFVFQDDLIHPECIHKLLAAATESDLIVGCRRKLLFADVSAATQRSIEHYLEHHSIETIYPDSKRIAADDFCRIALNKPGINFVGEPTAVIVRRDAFVRFGRFNPRFVQLCDFECWARIASNTGLVYVNEELATFRLHSKCTSMTNARDRAFRTRELERLVLFHEYAHCPHFGALRAFARHEDTPINLASVMDREAYWWYLHALRDSMQPGSDGALLAEWQALVDKVPSIRNPISFLRRDIGGWFAKHLLWRLKRPSNVRTPR